MLESLLLRTRQKVEVHSVDTCPASMKRAVSFNRIVNRDVPPPPVHSIPECNQRNHPQIELDASLLAPLFPNQINQPPLDVRPGDGERRVHRSLIHRPQIERLQARLGERRTVVIERAQDAIVVKRHLRIRVLKLETEVPVSGEAVVGDGEVGDGEGVEVDGWELGTDDDEEDEEDEA
uniref:Uncharacterized protein n=1 Tax=Brassica campestris TaxID=3711 RepID=M4D0P1_BRACM